MALLYEPLPFLANTMDGLILLINFAIGFKFFIFFFITNYLYTRICILSTKYHMLSKIKQKFKFWREKWTVDHTIDVVVDVTLLLIDVIMSPVLICVRLVRYLIGDWITDRIKSGIKIVVHWWEKRSKPVRRLLLILFLIILPFVLIIVYFFTEIINMYFEYNWDD